VKRGYAKLSQQPELYQRAQPAVNNDISKGLKDQDRKTGLIWHPLYVNLQLCNLETEGNQLFSFHTFIGFLGLQMSLEFVFVLLQVHNPRLFPLIILDVHIDAALANVGIDPLDLLTQLFFIV